MAEYPNGSGSEEETNKTSALPNFVPQILPDGAIAEVINSKNSKQREVFDVVHTWVKAYVKYDGNNVEPIHIFLSDSGGTGKSHLVKAIYNAISKNCFVTVKTQKNQEFFYFGLQKYQQYI